MIKEILTDIDAGTWAGPIPLTIQALRGRRRYRFNFASSMISLARVSGAPHQLGFSLHDIWAWLRYFPALSNSTSLALRPEWKDVDPHQKTLLSDDFGVGIAVDVLSRELGFVWVVPTSVFLHNNPGGYRHVHRSRVGPSKAPDFVAMDTMFRLHVMECKGTQTSEGGLLGVMTGGVAQKLNLRFTHPGVPQGERLVTGVFISKSHRPSLLRITDPEADNPIVVHAALAEIATAMQRSQVVSDLRLSGFHSIADFLSTGGTISRTELRGVLDRYEANIVLDRRSYGKSVQHSFALDEGGDSVEYVVKAYFGIDASVLDVYTSIDPLPPERQILITEETENHFKAVTNTGMVVDISLNERLRRRSGRIQ